MKTKVIGEIDRRARKRKTHVNDMSGIKEGVEEKGTIHTFRFQIGQRVLPSLKLLDKLLDLWILCCAFT